MIDTTHVIQIVVTIVALLLLAGVWYGIFFKETWEEIVQINALKKTLDHEMRGALVLVILLTVIVVGQTTLLNVLNPSSILLGVGYALGISSVTMVPAGFMYALGAKQPILHWLINSGYWLIASAGIGYIFAIWP